LRDVVVIGAGPAGSITARILAEAGRDVLVLEEHDVIGADSTHSMSSICRAT
jgi:flavin-dependent dehydrogenase